MLPVRFQHHGRAAFPVGQLTSRGDSGMRLLNSGIGAQFRNFHFEQANAGIAQIPTSRGTYVDFWHFECNKPLKCHAVWVKTIIKKHIL